MIAIPRHVGNICLLLVENLSPIQRAQCIKFTSRSYSVVDQHGGANLADIAYNGISLALLQQDPLLLQDALDRTGRDAVFASPNQDGIQVDGSYLFHDGQLYNGNYGEEHVLNLMTMFDIMRNSNQVWFPSNVTLAAFSTLVSGSEWMMVGYNNNTLSPASLGHGLRSRWLWQYNALSRMISFRSSDQEGTAGILFGMDQLDRIVRSWRQMVALNTTAGTATAQGISNAVLELKSTITRLNDTYSSSTPHGPLLGTRYFWNADYLVHRCHGFVTTLKMVSTRTTTSECINDQNTKGYHLNDGSLFTYQQGTEYLDIFGAWDWHRVPGTTTTTPPADSTSVLACDKGKRHYGKQAFVGAAVLQHNQIAVAVMNFTDPHENSNESGSLALPWRKTFYFFPSMYAVQMDSLTIAANGTSDDDLPSSTYTTTLDQRRRSGDIYIDGRRSQNPNGNFSNVSTLWHDKTLYSFETPVNLTLDVSTHISDWPSIGASQGTEPVDLWLATMTNSANESSQFPSLTYTVQPNYGIHRHQSKSPLNFISTQQVRGALSRADHTLALAFWAPGSINIPWSHADDDGDDGVDVYIETIHPLTILLQQHLGNGTWTASISDPTQSLTSTTVKISVDQEELPTQYDIDFPQGVRRGSTVAVVLLDEP